MNSKFDDFFSEVNDYNPINFHKDRLNNIVKSLNEKRNITNTIVFICTHNSRRSQLCQVWGCVFSKIYGIDLIFYSAGSKKTDVNQNVMSCLSDIGINVKDNKILFEDLSISLYSKTLDEISVKKFIAIMTCSDAEKSCPSDPRSIKNIKMIYEDPKIFDNTNREKEEYSKTSKLIAKEINYIIKKLVNPI